MINDFDKPEHIQTVNSLLAQLDGKEIAAGCNATTKSNLEARSAMKVVEMVGLSALRTGKPVTVAGIHAAVDLGAGKLKLSFFAEIDEVAIIPGEEGL